MRTVRRIRRWKVELDFGLSGKMDERRSFTVILFLAIYLLPYLERAVALLILSWGKESINSNIKTKTDSPRPYLVSQPHTAHRILASQPVTLCSAPVLPPPRKNNSTSTNTRTHTPSHSPPPPSPYQQWQQTATVESPLLMNLSGKMLA